MPDPDESTDVPAHAAAMDGAEALLKGLGESTAPPVQPADASPAPAVSAVSAGSAAGAPGQGVDLGLLREVAVEVGIQVGQVRVPLGALMHLAPGQVLEVGRSADAPADILVNGAVVGAGELVVLDGELAVRVTSLRSA